MIKDSPTKSFPVFTQPNKVKQVCGISRSTALRMEAEGNFPRRRRITPGGLTAWRTDELLQWADEREVVGGEK